MRASADSLFLFYFVMYSIHWSISAALIPWAFKHSMSRDINRFILMLPRSLLPVCNRFLITVLLYHDLSYLSIGKSRFFVIFLFFLRGVPLAIPRGDLLPSGRRAVRAPGSRRAAWVPVGDMPREPRAGLAPSAPAKTKKNNYEKRLTSSRNYDIMLS